MTMPHPDVWNEARGAYDSVKSYEQMPPDARRAIDALSNLIGVYDGYGE